MSVFRVFPTRPPAVPVARPVQSLPQPTVQPQNPSRMRVIDGRSGLPQTPAAVRTNFAVAPTAPSRRRNRPAMRFEDGSILDQETNQASGGGMAAAWALTQQSLSPPVPTSRGRRLELQQEEQNEFPETPALPSVSRRLDMVQEAKPAPREEVIYPKCLVQFELRDGSKVKTFYHRTVVNDAMLVLVMDKNGFVQTQYYPPQATEEPFAVAVSDEKGNSKAVFLCYYVGMNFSDGDHDYTILVIDRQSNKTEGENE